jgi:hypothetical protein
MAIAPSDQEADCGGAAAPTGGRMDFADSMDRHDGAPHMIAQKREYHHG